MCMPNSPLFQRCQVYDWPPFFNKKYMNGLIFLDSYVKGPIFLTSWYMHIFFAWRFFEAAYPLDITWIDCDICAITSKKWVQKIKGQYMNRSTFWMIKYMNGSVFFEGQVYEWGRFWNTGSHTRTKITPKLSPPPHPPQGQTMQIQISWLLQKTLRIHTGDNMLKMSNPTFWKTKLWQYLRYHIFPMSWETLTSPYLSLNLNKSILLSAHTLTLKAPSKICSRRHLFLFL